MTAAAVVTLQRLDSGDEGTFGRLSFGGVQLLSIELPWRNNLVQRSCIPPGVYSCALVRSPKFGHVYAVRNVPGRSAILLHAANLAGNIDVGWQSQLYGCIAPCRRLGRLRNKYGLMQQAGLVSRSAVAELQDWAGGRPFTLEIHPHD